jgi:DNA-binding CsgD family transcriptional regulator
MEEAKTTETAPKREEQVLVLAAGGMTDKEIAVRLGISPDTVGTYWRRILAKYQAASRTEVVAKYTQQRAKVAVDHLRYVNECLRLVADHMIEQAASRSAEERTTLADAIIASTPDWIILVDMQGAILMSNRPLPGESDFHAMFETSGEVPLGEILASGAAEGVRVDLRAVAPTPERLQGDYDAILAPCLGETVGRIVVSARRRLD